MIRIALTAPRHPLARIALGLLGLALLALLSFFGLALAALLTAGLIGRSVWLRLRGQQSPTAQAADPLVIDGEFKVVERSRLPPQL